VGSHATLDISHELAPGLAAHARRKPGQRVRDFLAARPRPRG
jgi:hypothetical protein